MHFRIDLAFLCSLLALLQNDLKVQGLLVPRILEGLSCGLSRIDGRLSRIVEGLWR